MRTCTLITTAPNELVAGVHNRIPAILRPEEEALWLDTSEKNVPDLLHLLRPYPAVEMDVFAISKMVNAAGIDDPALLNWV